MGSVLIGLLWLVAGVAVAFMARRFTRTYVERSVWPTVIGKTTGKTKMMLSSSVEGPSYYPLIEYIYRVGGKDYTSWRVYSHDISSGASSCERLFKRFQGAVTVHYDPSNPEETFLYLNSHGWRWSLYLFALFCLFMGIIFILPKLFP